MLHLQLLRASGAGTHTHTYMIHDTLFLIFNYYSSIITAVELSYWVYVTPPVIKSLRGRTRKHTEMHTHMHTDF